MSETLVIVAVGLLQLAIGFGLGWLWCELRYDLKGDE